MHKLEHKSEKKEVQKKISQKGGTLLQFEPVNYQDAPRGPSQITPGPGPSREADPLRAKAKKPKKPSGPLVEF
jgi:hypothetical protein